MNNKIDIKCLKQVIKYIYFKNSNIKKSELISILEESNNGHFYIYGRTIFDNQLNYDYKSNIHPKSNLEFISNIITDDFIRDSLNEVDFNRLSLSDRITIKRVMEGYKT